MRLTPKTLGANGVSDWTVAGPLLSSPGGLSIDLTFSADANLTASCQYTYDDPSQSPVLNVALARTGTSLNVNLPQHNLIVGDAVDLLNGTVGTWNGQGKTGYAVATVVDENNFTVTVANSGPASDTSQARTYRLFLHPTLKNLSGVPPTRTDGTFNWQIAAFRLLVSGWTAGKATLGGSQGLGS